MAVWRILANVKTFVRSPARDMNKNKSKQQNIVLMSLTGLRTFVCQVEDFTRGGVESRLACWRVCWVGHRTVNGISARPAGINV